MLPLSAAFWPLRTYKPSILFLFRSQFAVCRIYGITVLQTYTYFRKYPNDSTGLKALVSAIFLFADLNAN